MILSEVNNMKEKLQHFMMGRYGIDSFSKFLLGVTVFFCVIDLFFHSVVLNSWTLLLLIYTYYRALQEIQESQITYEETIIEDYGEVVED